MLSQSDIFNRLPISNEQKAQLYDALLQEQRHQTKMTNMSSCEFPKISEKRSVSHVQTRRWPDQLEHF